MNQSACCNVSNDFEEETIIKNTFLQVVRREQSRPRACSVPWCWRPECINESFVEVPVPFRERKEEVMSSLVEIPYFVSQDEIQPRAVEQFADISEVVEEPVLKVSSQDQFLGVPVSWVKGKLVKVPILVCQDSVQKRAFEQFADVPEVLEEPFFVGFPRNKVQQRVVEQNIEFLVDRFKSQTSDNCGSFESCLFGVSTSMTVP